MHCQFCGAALEKISEACPFCGSQVVLGDRYEIRAVLGRGAMGEVFYAYDRRLANEVALKRLNPQLTGSQELRESLTREARIMARLSDAGIVRLFDLADFDSGLYLVLEYVCGPNLREMLRAGYRASPVELVIAMNQICQALTAAHNQGVIHRDLKPSNLLVGLRQPERDAWLQSKQMPKSLGNTTIKIADFGIAKAIADSKSTLTNAFSGTPGYMAPEQFRGESPSPATDVYALGVMSYELLTGELPKQPMPSLPGVHPFISNVLGLATQPGRQSRFQTAAAFYSALYNAVEGKPFDRPILRPATAPKPVRTILAIAIGALLFIFAVAFFLAFQDQPKPQTALTKMPTIPAELLETPVKIVAHSAPRVVAPPQVVAEAAGRLPEDGLIGPKKPKLKWSLLLDTMTVRNATVGKDGTFYATTLIGELFAIRDGKIAWAYKLGFGAGSKVQLDKEGRIWVDGIDESYSFNRDGEGGRLPPTVKAPPEREIPTYNCLMNHQVWGPGIKLDLDGDCTGSSIAARPGGPIYVATDLPQLMALNRRGDALWKIKLPCDPYKVMIAGPDRLLYTCKDETIHNLIGQSETWTHPANGTLSSSMEVGGDGILYFSDSPKQSGHYLLHTLDSTGNVLSSFNLGGRSLDRLILGAQNQLYVTASSMGTRIMRLED